MMYLPGMRRITLVSAVLVVVADVALLAVAFGMVFAGHASRATSPIRPGGTAFPMATSRHAAHKESTSAMTPPPLSTYHPLRVVPPKYVVTATAIKMTSIATTSTAPTNVVRLIPGRYMAT